MHVPGQQKINKNIHDTNKKHNLDGDYTLTNSFADPHFMKKHQSLNLKHQMNLHIYTSYANTEELNPTGNQL